MPRWQNVFKIYKDVWMLIIMIMIFYLIVVVAYIFGYFENTYKDIFLFMVRALAIVCNSCTAYNPKLLSTRMGMGLCLIGALWHYVLVVSMFCSVIKVTFLKHQVGSWEELIDNEFTLIGDHSAESSIRQSAIVSNHRIFIKYQ